MKRHCGCGVACLCSNRMEYMRKIHGYTHEEMEAKLAPHRAMTARLCDLLDRIP